MREKGVAVGGLLVAQYGSQAETVRGGGAAARPGIAAAVAVVAASRASQGGQSALRVIRRRAMCRAWSGSGAPAARMWAVQALA